jgi:hypothetical protein
MSILAARGQLWLLTAGIELARGAGVVEGDYYSDLKLLLGAAVRLGRRTTKLIEQAEGANG